jgi:hypothetical protein
VATGLFIDHFWCLDSYRNTASFISAIIIRKPCESAVVAALERVAYGNSFICTRDLY